MAAEPAADQAAREREGMSRIVLRPIGSPIALGFLGLGAATVVLSGVQLDWYGPAQTTAVALTLVAFAFPLQLLASIFGFLARDAAAATGMGILAASWLATGLVKLLTPPGSTSAALGVLLLYAGAALLVPALASSLGKLVVALVLLTASARYLISGIYQLTVTPWVETAAGISGLVLLGVALYAALALALEDVQRKTVLPVLRLGMGKAALRGSAFTQIVGVENEAGVREQL